ncbi:MAG: two-component system, chemotaxis family, protein-glutamate methylesterase/glutaminase [Tenuifilum sp.]|jgi:two-component system chemotaxis response regulator CheB|uniref:chemotaxis protein CheB n=1 Tax=Tenuifilum sp. TaxID=2760880 RepID=UPI0024AC3A89|nr:chemotaxis protein CheB [Tenuifilum sp.]MDI3526249.1 two-component system, chemotaxis family, protein-glutamate methylesterase/glutaminase [Tenuifilum sp.]
MYKAVIIGGSAGSFQVITRILHSLSPDYPLPVLLCLHRLKHVRSGFMEALSIKSGIPIIEPNDKEQIKPGKAYLAPANYHMFVELGNKIALSTEDPVNHSRPSIDLSFITAAQVYREKLVGIILSGANRDGAYGLKKIKDLGGLAIVQDPNECQVRTMTEASLRMTPVDHVFTTNEIIRFLQKIKA